jgi:FkbM family methyltransferase
VSRALQACPQKIEFATVNVNQMKKKTLFAKAEKILRKFIRSEVTILRISNAANLVYFMLTRGSRFHFRTDFETRFSLSFEKYFDDGEKLDVLKGRLEDESKDLIDLVLARLYCTYRKNLFDNLTFSESEKREQEKIKRNSKGKSFDGLSADSPEIFFYHHGLKLLNDSILERIRGCDVIDGGAFNGDSAMVFSREDYGFRKIYSFEPEKKNFETLKNNLIIFGLSRCIPIHAGLGDLNTSQKILADAEGSHVSEYGDEVAKFIKLDDFVQQNNLSVGLIKLDIEGGEYEAIRGAAEAIKKQRPALLVAVYHRGRDFFEIKPLIEQLCPNQYDFKIVKLNPFHMFCETYLIATPKL